MFKYFVGLMLVVMSMTSSAEVIWTSADLRYVLGGYPDKSIAFVPVEAVENPAGCANTDAYVMQGDHDTKAALSILLSAKLSGKKVHFSIRDDVCHTVQQTDTNVVLPVIQRIAVL